MARLLLFATCGIIHHSGSFVFSSKKPLLAPDGSDWALEAVRYVSKVFLFRKMQLVLFRVFSKTHECYWDLEWQPKYGRALLLPFWWLEKTRRGEEKEWIEGAKKEIGIVFDEAKSHLMKSGLESSQITTKIIMGAPSRAGAVVDESKQGGYGTIVVGRRGLSKVREFFIGRVSNKVIHLAKR